MSIDQQTQERLYLDGAWHERPQAIEVRSPFDGRLVARVARGDAHDAQDAVDAAARAMRTPLPAAERADVLDRVAALLDERAEAFAHTLALEVGKPLKAARVEVQRARTTFALSAGEARRLAGSAVPLGGTIAGAAHLAFTVRVPVGVVGAITPFNFPLNLVAHKLAPAIAAGCAVVLKPASQAPLSALALARACEDAGLPAGWLNVVPGGGAAIGDVLVSDDRVALVSFTGSSEVGWDIRSRAPQKKVTLELGNASPLIVEPDADLDLAAEKIARHAFGFAGQSCVSVQRVLVHESVHDALIERTVPLVERLVVGDPLDEATDVGPLVDRANHERVLSWVDEAVAGGARALTGGAERDGLLPPTLLADVRPEMRVCREEVFGPVCTVARYGSLEEALALANGTPYGLQAAIFTRSLDAAMRAVAGLEFGGVLVNEAPEWRVDQMPYGGVKTSGNTKEGPAYTIREMSEERLVVLGQMPL